MEPVPQTGALYYRAGAGVNSTSGPGWKFARTCAPLKPMAASAACPLSQQFERQGVIRIPAQQPFEGGDAVCRTVSADIDPGQRHVRGLVLRRPLKHSLEKSHGL